MYSDRRSGGNCKQREPHSLYQTGCNNYRKQYTDIHDNLKKTWLVNTKSKETEFRRLTPALIIIHVYVCTTGIRELTPAIYVAVEWNFHKINALGLCSVRVALALSPGPLWRRKGLVHTVCACPITWRILGGWILLYITPPIRTSSFREFCNARMFSCAFVRSVLND